MIHRKINLWPALPVFVLLAALFASRLMADAAPIGNDPSGPRSELQGGHPSGHPLI